MTSRTIYKVKTSHSNWAAGNGTFELTVETELLSEDRCWGKVNAKRYVHGGPFGCSRDYYVGSDKEAVQSLLAEHATTLVSIRKVR